MFGEHFFNQELNKVEQLEKLLRLCQRKNIGMALIGKLHFLIILEPILRVLNLQLQRQRCSRLERFFQSR
jgi:hypothetical protein